MFKTQEIEAQEKHLMSGSASKLLEDNQETVIIKGKYEDYKKILETKTLNQIKFIIALVLNREWTKLNKVLLEWSLAGKNSTEQLIILKSVGIMTFMEARLKGIKT
jgi:hypothetical protein